MAVCGEKQDTSTLGRTGKARKKCGDNRHFKERKERDTEIQTAGWGRSDFSKKSQVLVSPPPPSHHSCWPLSWLKSYFPGHSILSTCWKLDTSYRPEGGNWFRGHEGKFAVRITKTVRWRKNQFPFISHSPTTIPVLPVCFSWFHRPFLYSLSLPSLFSSSVFLFLGSHDTWHPHLEENEGLKVDRSEMLLNCQLDNWLEGRATG